MKQQLLNQRLNPRFQLGMVRLLGLWLGTWEGSIRREPAGGSCAWLRFYDAMGNLVLLPEESERQRANQEQQRAEQAEQEKIVLLERL
ncbi:MAG TPA: hypothetical protein V6C65_03340 [Allocoleopsis sp.]